MKKSDFMLKSILKECDKHLKRMNFAFGKIQQLLPFTHLTVSKITEDEISYIDQVIYRFTKLQDAVGQKLFKSVLIFLDEDVFNKSAIDIFNRLEQLNIVENYEVWQELRHLRNELSHEYEEDESETAEKLNALFEKKDNLEKYIKDITAYLTKNGFWNQEIK